MNYCTTKTIYFQANYVQLDALLPNGPPHSPNDSLVLFDVDLHDVQRMVVHSCSGGGGSRVFFIRVEKIGYR